MARQRNAPRLTLVLGLALIVSACHYHAPSAYHYGGYFGKGYGHQGHHGHGRGRPQYEYSW